MPYRISLLVKMELKAELINLITTKQVPSFQQVKDMFLPKLMCCLVDQVKEVVGLLYSPVLKCKDKIVTSIRPMAPINNKSCPDKV